MEFRGNLPLNQCLAIIINLLSKNENNVYYMFQKMDFTNIEMKTKVWNSSLESCQSDQTIFNMILGIMYRVAKYLKKEMKAGIS